jgi:hypothetical protein
MDPGLPWDANHELRYLQQEVGKSDRALSFQFTPSALPVKRLSMKSRTEKLLCFVMVMATALIPGAHSGNSQTQSTSPVAESALPRSMKGYELYSWQARGQWNFTLITGTNALPSAEGITTGPDWIKDGFVKLTVKSVDALKVQLRRLPQDAEISWGNSTLEGFHFELPPQAIVDAVVSYCKKLGLNLWVVP